VSEPRQPPGHAGPETATPPRELLPSSSSAEELAVGVASPRDQRRRASLPWLAAALILAGAVLALAYVVLLRPPRE
jgi:hypothetical protein